MKQDCTCELPFKIRHSLNFLILDNSFTLDQFGIVECSQPLYHMYCDLLEDVEKNCLHDILSSEMIVELSNGVLLDFTFGVQCFAVGLDVREVKHKITIGFVVLT